jgi:lipoate-protein ligase A
MAVDEAILAAVNGGSSPPTVRVYGWEPPTVSTGYSQSIERELDLEECRRRGFGVVVRPTGGRAVLHAGELTYSVVGRSGEPPLGTTIMETYLAIAQGLVAGLALLGLSAELAQVSTGPRERGDGASPPCFASAGRYEVVVGGRKLIGSAQRRVGRAVLQHGSLLIDATHEALADVQRVRDDREREVFRRALASKTTTLADALGRDVSFDEVARAVRLGFEDAWGFLLDEGGLTEGERNDAERLATERTVVG